MLDAVISLKLLALETSHLGVGVGNRGVLGQVPVDDQFAPVRRREKLLLHELHAKDREQEGCHGHADGDPPVMHADQQEAREQPSAPVPFLRDGPDLGRQDGNARATA